MELQQRPRISVSMNRKINLGNYESTDIFVSIAHDQENFAADEIRMALDACEQLMNEKVKEIIKKSEKK